MVADLFGTPNADMSSYALDISKIGDMYRSIEVSAYIAHDCFDDTGAMTAATTADMLTSGDVSALPSCTSIAIWSNRSAVVLDALLNMGKTLFVMVVLSLGAIMFTRDAEVMVIGPIEHILKMVDCLARDPTYTTKVEAKRTLTHMRGKRARNHTCMRTRHAYRSHLGTPHRKMLFSHGLLLT